MRQPSIAFGVFVHKNPKQVDIFIEQLLSYRNSYVFLHIDAKAPFDAADIKPHKRLVVVEERIDASWGDISLVDIMLLLLNKVSHHDVKFDWVSMHSGMDLAVRPVDELAQFLKKGGLNGYIDSMPLPITGWGRKGGFERVELVYPKFLRQRPKKYSIVRYIRHLYQLAYAGGLIRKRKNPLKLSFRGGSQWLTLSGSTVEDMLRYLGENPSYYDFFQEVLIPDEVFFQTLINTLYVDAQDRFEYSNNLRYIDWYSGRQVEIGAPATLIFDDIPAIEASGSFFARKFDMMFDQAPVSYFEALIADSTGGDHSTRSTSTARKKK